MINLIGGSGFIGTSIVKKLIKSDSDFKILDIKKPNHEEYFYHTDVCEISTLRKNIAEDSIIINLAAEHKDNITPTTRYYDVNVEGAKNICKIAEEKNVQTIIFTSSVAIYGFAKLDTDEQGEINPFNDYGKSKYEAELIYKKWQEKDPYNRTLTVIRPTVVFGERNRGNVYNLLKQVHSKRFLKIGSGLNKKSIAYVENVSDFIIHSIEFTAKYNVYNYVDKPDITMNELVDYTKGILSYNKNNQLRLPYHLALFCGFLIDILSKAVNKEFSISSIRIKKFCSSTTFSTSIEKSGFKPKVDIFQALKNTILHEFDK